MIHFTCPCGKALHAREEYVGQTTRCPQCGRELLIPGEKGVQAQAPPPPRDSADDEPRDRPRRRPDRDWADRPRPPAVSGMAVASMVLGLASLLCTVFTAIPALILGGLGLRAVNRSEGKLQGKGFAVTGLVAGGVGLLLLFPLFLFLGVIPFVQFVSETGSKRDAGRNLEQIASAMNDYESAMGTFPPAALCDADGKPLLSWRVAILPYIEQDSLYKQFNLNEPWDSPHNLPLVAKMPKIYALPGATAQPGYTYYRVFVGHGAAFDEPRRREVPDDANNPGGIAPGADAPLTRGVSPNEFTDGTSETILVAEAANAVPWTKPDELPYDPNAALPPLGGHFSSSFVVALADGSYRVIPKNISQATLRAAITRDAGDIPGPDW